MPVKGHPLYILPYKSIDKIRVIPHNQGMKTEEIIEAITDSLPPGEDIFQLIEEVEIEKKNYSVAITPNRIVLCKHSFGNRITNEDYPSTRFDKIKLDEGWRRTTVNVKLKDGNELKLEQIKKEDARKMAGYIRTMISRVEAGPKITKICPDCGAHLSTLVKVCPHCEYDFKKSMRKN